MKKEITLNQRTNSPFGVIMKVAALFVKNTAIKRTPFYCVTLLFALAFGNALYAQDAKRLAAEQEFKRYDINKDGWLDGTELNACKCKHFDKDGDNEISKAEFFAGRGLKTATTQASDDDDAAEPDETDVEDEAETDRQDEEKKTNRADDDDDETEPAEVEEATEPVRQNNAWKKGDWLEVKWGDFWKKAQILEVKGDQYKIHYDGYGNVYDEWITTERMRRINETVKTNPPQTVKPENPEPVRQNAPPVTEPPDKKVTPGRNPNPANRKPAHN